MLVKLENITHRLQVPVIWRQFYHLSEFISTVLKPFAEEGGSSLHRRSGRGRLPFRMFDHGAMKKVSGRITDVGKMPYSGEDPILVDKLRAFAGLFVQLQEQRHEADYNIKDAWTLTQSLKEMLAANRAFAIWLEIRSEKISQDYLVSLLIRPRE